MALLGVLLLREIGVGRARRRGIHRRLVRVGVGVGVRVGVGVGVRVGVRVRDRVSLRVRASSGASSARAAAASAPGSPARGACTTRRAAGWRSRTWLGLGPGSGL